MGARQGLILLLLWVCSASVIARDLPLHQLILPAGFKIELYTDKVPNARSLHLSPSGTLFVGSRNAGKVYAVRDNDGDGRAERVHVIASGLNTPNGVAFHQAHSMLPRLIVFCAMTRLSGSYVPRLNRSC